MLEMKRGLLVVFCFNEKGLCGQLMKSEIQTHKMCTCTRPLVPLASPVHPHLILNSKKFKFLQRFRSTIYSAAHSELMKEEAELLVPRGKISIFTGRERSQCEYTILDKRSD